MLEEIVSSFRAFNFSKLIKNKKREKKSFNLRDIRRDNACLKDLWPWV